ncbi:NmrA family transcriptional regulator [Streptomyces sp. NPDC050549]|uniref:NmrA family transcriptional regulator n=1 Tax=Streptomyces sp. NPDC050549 TaxID=3155406 RepID=UPI00343BCCBD
MAEAVRAARRAQGLDWADRSTWADTLRGADAAYLVYPSDVGAPDAPGAVGPLAREAVGLGVLLSSRGEERARPTEEAPRGSGADWRVARAAWFAQNFSEGPLVAGLRESGELVFPAGDVREPPPTASRAWEVPPIDVRDIADVAAVTAGDRYAGQAVTMSGPRLLSFGEAVAEISAAAGRALTYRAVSARQYGGDPAGFGVPDGEVEFLVELFESLLDGRNSHLSDGVQQVLGREPRDFSEFAREASAAGVRKV